MGLRKAFTRALDVDNNPGLAPFNFSTTRLALDPIDNLLASTGGNIQGVTGYTGLEVFRGAMGIPAFWRGSNLMAGLLAQVPWDAYTVHGRDQDELISPRPPLLEQPAPPHSRFATFKSMFLDYLANGNAIGIIATRDGNGRPTAIWPVPSSYCGVRRVNDSNSPIGLPVGAIEYWISGKEYSSNDVIHVMGPSAPGAIRGFGILEAHFFGALATAHEQQRQARNISRPGVPPGVIQVMGDDEVEAEELECARDKWMEHRDNGGVAALNANMKFEPISWNPDQAQMIQARQLTLNEIANLLGLPASFVNSTNSGGTSLTYSTVDSEALGLLKWTMSEHFANWEQTFSLMFPRGTSVRADLDHFLRGDTQSRYNSYFTGIGSGWLLRSEVRSLEKLPPVPGIDNQPLPAKVEKSVMLTDPKSGLSVPAPGDQTPEVVNPSPPAAELPAAGQQPPAAGHRAVSRLQLTPQGRQLWDYWTGEGKAHWADAPHPYDTLRAQLADKAPPETIDGLAAGIFHAVFHMTPTQHAKMMKG